MDEAGLVRDSVLALAAQQHWVVTLEQLNACGLSASGVRKRVAAGRLHRVHAGVYAVGRPDLPPRGNGMAAVLACGPGALLSYASAAALRGIRDSAAAMIDITVTHPSPINRPGIRVHRHESITAADITSVDGIPVTSVSRTLLDLATILTDPQLERACEQAVVEGVFDMGEMSDLLVRSKGQRGVRRLRRVLARGDLEDGAPASGLERRFRRLCRDAGLPKPELNRWVLLGDEYHKVDFLWRRERVVIETDGGPYHATGWQHARDRRRDELLRANGYRALRVPDTELGRDPAAVIRRAADLLGQAPSDG